MAIEEARLKVTLVTAPTKSMVGLAAKLCTTPDSLEEIQAKYTDDELNQIGMNAIGYGHMAVAEADDYLFVVEGVSRTLTHQLVRKRIAQYWQESMRYASQAGVYKVVIPQTLAGKSFPLIHKGIPLLLSLEDLADIAHQFYEAAQKEGVPNEDARFALLEASKTKIGVKMNAHALIDFFKVRTCTCAQWEIRAMAREMLRLCKEHNYNLFRHAGPQCLEYGMCREAKPKHRKCNRMPHVEEVQKGLTVPFEAVAETP